MENVGLIIERCEWCDEARKMLRATIRATFAKVDYEKQGGILLRVCRTIGGDRPDAGVEVVGYVVLSTDGEEGVIEAATGCGRGVDLVDVVLPHIERLFYGIKAIRVSTARRGLVMKLASHGYTVTHFNLRKVVA